MRGVWSRSGRGIVGVASIWLAGCVIVVMNSVTTLTVVPSVATERFTQDQRAIALEVARTVAADHALKTTKEPKRLPASFGDGRVFIEVWARRDPLRFEYVMTVFNRGTPPSRAKQILLAIERQLAEKLPGFAVTTKLEL